MEKNYKTSRVRYYTWHKRSVNSYRKINKKNVRFLCVPKRPPHERKLDDIDWAILLHPPQSITACTQHAPAKKKPRPPCRKGEDCGVALWNVLSGIRQETQSGACLEKRKVASPIDVRQKVSLKPRWSF